MKTVFLSLAALILATAPLRLFAIDVAFELNGGIQNGLTQEYVYEGEQCISRLDWADAIVPALSIAGSVELFNVLLQARLDTALPVNSGVMEDYDFLTTGSSDPSLYSKHDAYLDKDITCTLFAAYALRVGNFELTPGVGYSYSNRKWSAQDGYLQYPVAGAWTGDEPKQAVVGTVISYEQAVWFPFISLSVGYTLNRFGFSFTGSVSPVLKGETIDTHFMRSVRFYDTLASEIFADGIAWHISLTLFYYPANQSRLAFFLRGNYEAIAGLTGSTSSGATGIDSGNIASDGTLVIDNGYRSKMERHTIGVGVGIVFKVAP
jgi:outer membrane protease